MNLMVYITDFRDEEITNLLDDFVFICFLLGNDFIPKIPWLSIYNSGNEILSQFIHKFIINTENF